MPGGTAGLSSCTYICPSAEDWMHYSGPAKLKTSLPVRDCSEQQSSRNSLLFSVSISSSPSLFLPHYLSLPLSPSPSQTSLTLCLSLFLSLSLSPSLFLSLCLSFSDLSLSLSASLAGYSFLYK